MNITNQGGPCSSLNTPLQLKVGPIEPTLANVVG